MDNIKSCSEEVIHEEEIIDLCSLIDDEYEQIRK